MCSTPFPGSAGVSSDGETIAYESATGPARDRGDGPAGPLAVGEPFGARYRILRELGAGGMGVVYQAWDEDLGVPVALKVIRTEVGADPNLTRDVERRFKRELLLARQVTHHNVVRIYDLGDINGIKYITMSFVEGVDLATLIQREGRLTVSRALRMVRGVVSGLRAAHAAGVVHRDLKPANIMIDEQDEARIMDFGIARSTSLPADAPGAPGEGAPKPIDLTKQAAMITATMDGGVVGTVEYMAPEQARGEDVDQRADLYALGLIIYDMLGGAGRAARSNSALGELTARMQQQPPAIRTLNPDVPEALARVISRCLEPDAKARHASTKDLEADLHRLDDEGNLLPVLRRVSTRQMAAAGIITAILLVGTWRVSRPAPVVVQPPPTSVLIEDFKNETGDPVFDGTLEQSLAIALEGSPFISVYPVKDARAIAAQISPDKGTKINDEVGRLIARREGLKVLVSGFIEPRDRGYHLGVRATDPATAKLLTAVTGDVQDKRAVLKTVASMAVKVREALGESKSEMTNLAAAETATAGSLEAMQAFARGQDLLSANKFDEAVHSYQEAVRLDPAFGRAYAGMGTIYANLKQQNNAEAAYREAFKHVDRMTEREKFRTLGGYYNLVAGNSDKAIENYENLVRLYPADTGGHGNLALAYVNAGNIPKAIAEVRKFLEVYPNNLIQRYNYAMYSMYAGNYQVSIDEGKRIAAATPSFEYAYLPIAASNLALGRVDDARKAYETMESVSPLGFSLASIGKADLEMYLGRDKEALAALGLGLAADEKQKEKRSAELAVKYVLLAEAQQALGRTRVAIAAADKAAALGKGNRVLFPAAQVFIAAGDSNQARAIADRLRNMLQSRSTAYAELITGEVAVREKHIAEGLDSFVKSRKLFDSWFGRFIAGRTYAQAEHYPEALAELELAVKRRGETTDVFVDDVPTLRYLPPVYYWLARTQEALGVTVDARKNYQRYLDLRATATTPDPLAADARRRLAP